MIALTDSDSDAKCASFVTRFCVRCADGSYLSPQQIDIHPLIIMNHEKAFRAISFSFQFKKKKKGKEKRDRNGTK